MSRPARAYIDTTALVHNIERIKALVSGQKIIAMVKADAYGCGMQTITPALANQVDGFGVACVEEAVILRQLGIKQDCILFEGIFNPEELQLVVRHQLQCVVHHMRQIDWLVNTQLSQKIKVWVKINTGMHRLGFNIDEVAAVMSRLKNCPWVHEDIVLMTHFACADEPEKKNNQRQIELFMTAAEPYVRLSKSLANSAATITLPAAHGDIVRPGIMLYGVSPFASQTGLELGLKPVMRFISAITVIREYPAHVSVGYGAQWCSERPSRIGIVAIGYGDGYPRHISPNTCVWVKGVLVPIVGRVSMDMLTIDLTDSPHIQVDDEVELWGPNLAVEQVARAAGTIGYELLTQVTQRVQRIKTT